MTPVKSGGVGGERGSSSQYARNTNTSTINRARAVIGGEEVLTEKEKRFRTSRSCKPSKKENGAEGGCSVSEEQTPHQSAALHMLKNTFKNAGLPGKGVSHISAVGVVPPSGLGTGNTMGGVDVDR